MLQIEPGALIALIVTVLGLLGGAFVWFSRFVQGQLQLQRDHDLVLVEKFDEIVSKINVSLTSLHSKLDDVRHNTCRCPKKP